LPRKAEGMDFIGKVKLLEEAKSNRQCVEIIVNDKERLIGRVSNLWKSTKGSQYVDIIPENSEDRYLIFDISKIQQLKIIVESIFS